MLDPRAEQIAYVMHAERLARARRNLRIEEAVRTRPPRERAGARCRVMVARLLIALAQRIMPAPRTTATTHAGAIPS
jgi:hypothetical protein